MAHKGHQLQALINDLFFFFKPSWPLLSVQFVGVEYTYIVVQPSPPVESHIKNRHESVLLYIQGIDNLS